MALESFDGLLLYYMEENKDCSELWSVPVSGGDETNVLHVACWRGFVPTKDGIWYLRPQSVGRFAGIGLKSFAGVTKVVASIKGDSGNGLSVSPDGSQVLYARREQRSALMLIENFR